MLTDIEVGADKVSCFVAEVADEVSTSRKCASISAFNKSVAVGETSIKVTRGVRSELLELPVTDEVAVVIPDTRVEI